MPVPAEGEPGYWDARNVPHGTLHRHFYPSKAVGSVREVDGFKFCYKICESCGHAVRYYYPAAEGTSAAVKNYRQWKKYMVQ